MTELFRALGASLALLYQLLAQGPLGPAPVQTPTPRRPRPTLTATAVPPTATRAPSSTATSLPSRTPTAVPSATSSASPSPTSVATATPTRSATPSASPSSTPTRTATATATETRQPTRTPTETSSPLPTAGQSVSDPTGYDVVGVPPAQKLPSALVVYPLIQASATQDTIIELLNLSDGFVSVHCFYLKADTCNELDFFLSLTPQQPVSWHASSGRTSDNKRVAPPVLGDNELKCVVAASSPDPAAHNVLQGRALVSDTSGQTIGYNAIAFRRLSPGPFTGAVDLDGITYEQCPDRLHFQALSSQPGSDSELVLVPCSEDLLNQVPASTPIQFAVINELEQPFSGSIGLTCFVRARFSTIPPLRRSTVGTDAVHAIVRGVDVPVIGLVIDRFTVPGSTAVSVSSNEPQLEGGRSATVILP
jgi:hypothetical protein